MKSINRNKTKIIKKLFRVLLVVIIITLAALGIQWNRYLNKYTLLKKFETTQNQEIYLLGSFHEQHFNKWLNYSMEDLISVIQNLQPDVVFVESREQYFKDYGVVDGPIDMAVIYSYCSESRIPVEMIDWWVVDNSYQGEDFQYPFGIEAVWRKHAYFYAYTFPTIVEQQVGLDDDIMSQFTTGDHDAFYNQQMEYSVLFSENELYR